MYTKREQRNRVLKKKLGFGCFLGYNCLPDENNPLNPPCQGGVCGPLPDLKQKRCSRRLVEIFFYSKATGGSHDNPTSNIPNPV